MILSTALTTFELKFKAKKKRGKTRGNLSNDLIIYKLL